jgi:hypothetical protein
VLYTSAQSSITQANAEIAAGIAASTAALRQTHNTNALNLVRSARSQFGSNISFLMGQGNLMF